jgi:hypothetical protein
VDCKIINNKNKEKEIRNMIRKLQAPVWSQGIPCGGPALDTRANLIKN